MVGATSGSGEAFRLASGLDLEAGGRPGNAFGGSGRALSPTPGRRCRLLGLCQSWVAGVLGPIKHKRGAALLQQREDLAMRRDLAAAVL